jgi:hypothetical protein
MSELESLTESLSSLSDKSSPADIARLFSGSDSPMGHLEEVSKARLEYLQELQNDLVSVRLTLQAGDEEKWGFVGSKIDKKTGAIKEEIDQIREFNKVFEDLKKVGERPEALEKFTAEKERANRIASGKAGFVEVAKDYILNFVKAVKDKLLGKSVDMEVLKSGAEGIVRHTANLQSENQELATKAKKFVKEEYPARVKERQKLAEPASVKQAGKFAQMLKDRRAKHGLSRDR